jgi:hypothetical protein
MDRRTGRFMEARGVALVRRCASDDGAANEAFVLVHGPALVFVV